MNSFTQTSIKAVGKEVYRLGLACNKGIAARDARAFLEDRLNYIYWTPFSRSFTPHLRELFARDRERYVLATGPTTGFFKGGIRRFTERMLRLLKTDYLDILQIHWLGVTSTWNISIADEMQQLKNEGKVKAIGLSIHDRKRAGLLAEEGILDSFMIRYNAAHPGAEKDIFPYISTDRHNVTAYTATSWQRLLKGHRGWDGRAMTAGECYRFCLSDEKVNVVLCGPKNRQQLSENIAALEQGPLSADEQNWIRRFGAVVHG